VNQRAHSHPPAEECRPETCTGHPHWTQFTAPKIEPNSNQREAAIACRQFFTALTEDGQFTEAQALAIIGAMLGGQR
jgi:hypothetical protein